MNIHEHQAKEILRNYGVPVSNGVVILSINEIKDKIKNRVKLNEDEFTYIKNSSHEEKLEIIKIYNFMM